jgi:hypothetical protein
LIDSIAKMNVLTLQDPEISIPGYRDYINRLLTEEDLKARAG